MTIWLSPYAEAFSISERALGYLFSYGGLFFDLLIVPFLLWKRTRQGAFLLAVGFHLANAGLFDIGVFPWFAIAATTLFLDPSWPRDLINSFSRSEGGAGRQAEASPSAPLSSPASLLGGRRSVVVGLLAVFVAVQIIVPLRHFAYPGNVNWGNEGSRFSWHMMIRDIYAERMEFRAEFAGGGVVGLEHTNLLSTTQSVRLAFYPDMVPQAARQMADSLREQGFGEAEIHAEIDVSLNGRQPQPLVDPTFDLASQPRSLAPAAWIVPLEEPLRAEADGPVRGEPAPP